ncbi:group II intron reverse transcriptase/maturase [Pseudomonas sp. S60]|nr:group II intron reverse transcriptase/maturase [Pseudomonas sp. S60]
MPPVGVTVSLVTVMQKFPTAETVTPSPDQKPRMMHDSAKVSTAPVAWTNAEPDTLMERVLAPANLRRAYKRVVSNKGAPGADGMTVADLAGYVKQYWPTLKARLLAGEYHPQAVRAVEISKPQGGTRQLGIPSVVDRLIQQALLQQLSRSGLPPPVNALGTGVSEIPQPPSKQVLDGGLRPSSSFKQRNACA